MKYFYIPCALKSDTLLYYYLKKKNNFMHIVYNVAIILILIKYPI